MSQGVQWSLGVCGDMRPAECTGGMGARAWFPCRQSCGQVVIARWRLEGSRRTMFWAPLDVLTYTGHQPRLLAGDSLPLQPLSPLLRKFSSCSLDTRVGCRNPVYHRAGIDRVSVAEAENW